MSGATSGILDGLFSDPETAALFSDEESIRAMVAVEAALARAQARVGLIPADAAERITAAAASFEPDLEDLRAGTEITGVPTVALVDQLRAHVGGEAAAYVHWGATSQDIIDTGLVLRLARLSNHMAGRLGDIIGTLADTARRHADTVMAARTRSQQALPTTFGLKAANWLAPLARHRKRLDQIRPRLLVVQLGAAVGSLAPMGGRGLEIMEAMAEDLGLGPATPWHTQRDGLVEFANWLAMVTVSLGKIGQDIMLMSYSEVGEAKDGGGGGGSSTMPQKANPIAAETLVALARLNAGLIGNIHQAALQEHERGGPGWQLEWLTLPRMAVACGAALRHAARLAGDLAVDPERMRANLDSSNGLIMAEAACFALAEHMPRPEAQALVKQACGEAARAGRNLFEVLKHRCDAPVDWQAVSDPANYLGEADALIRRILNEAGV